MVLRKPEYSQLSTEEPFNGEFANKLTEVVEAFFTLDEVCDEVKEKQICDAVGVRCDQIGSMRIFHYKIA